MKILYASSESVPLDKESENSSLAQDDNTNFFKLVERLKAGEKIPNVCLTKRGTVAFFIP